MKMKGCVVFLIAALVMMAMVTDAKRGRGRGRGKTSRLVGVMLPWNQDANSRSDYYNNPLGARIIVSSHFDYEYVLGHKIMFLCEAQGTPRPHISWYKDGTEIYSHPYMQLHEWTKGEDSMKSKLEIDPATQMDAGLYECHANNKYAIDRRVFKADFSFGD